MAKYAIRQATLVLPFDGRIAAGLRWPLGQMGTRRPSYRVLRYRGWRGAARCQPPSDRAPFLITPEWQSAWLDPSLTDADQVRELLLPAAEGALSWHPVFRVAGNVRNQGEKLVDPVPLSE